MAVAGRKHRWATFLLTAAIASVVTITVVAIWMLLRAAPAPAEIIADTRIGPGGVGG